MESSQHMETPSQSSNEATPLCDKWVLWAHLPHDTDWSLKSYIQLMQVETMEEMIALYNSIPPAMVKNCMLFLMRQNIKPMWEDPNNKQGGCFSFKVVNKNVPEVWKSVSYLLTGETLSSEKNFQDNITGITISPKKSFCILKIWMKDLEFQNPRVINEVTGLQVGGCLFKKHKPNY